MFVYCKVVMKSFNFDAKGCTISSHSASSYWPGLASVKSKSFAQMKCAFCRYRIPVAKNSSKSGPLPYINIFPADLAAPRTFAFCTLFSMA